MCWINTLIDCTDNTARAETFFPPDHFAVTNGTVQSTALIECVAQTAAAALGQRARARGDRAQPAAGMLAAISSFRIERRAAAGKALQIDVRDLKRFGPMLLVAGKVLCEGQEIASGELTLYA